jgi:hypothetical protein
MVRRAGLGLIFTVALGLAAPGARADAAADSVEGQLQSQGKHWVRARGEITLGAYVQDTLLGRANQPADRGDIGRVVSLAFGANGERDAMVDFGRGYSVGIHLSELSLVRVVSNGPWAAGQVADDHRPQRRATSADSSVEEQLRSRGKHWVRTGGEITLGAYVQDTLVGRLNQPAGRGSIGRVVALAFGANGQPDARVDFGRGYAVGIHLSELALVRVVSD